MMETNPRCPTCGSTALRSETDGLQICTRCGATIETELLTCPECGTVNPPGAERCSACDHHLDMVQFVLRERLGSATHRLEGIQQQAATLKEEAEKASQARMEQWLADEEERRRALAKAQMEQARQQRKLLIGVIVFVAVVLAVVTILVLASSSGPPAVTPTPLPQ